MLRLLIASEPFENKGHGKQDLHAHLHVTIMYVLWLFWRVDMAGISGAVKPRQAWQDKPKDLLVRAHARATGDPPTIASNTAIDFMAG